MLSKNYSRCWYHLWFMLLMCWSAIAQANVLEGIRVWPSPDSTRVVIDLTSQANFTYFTLSSPERLVVDLQQTKLSASLPLTLSDGAMVKRIRSSTPPNATAFRLVIELSSKSTPTIFTLPPTPGGQYGHRLVIDLPHASASTNNRPSSPSRSQPVVSRDASQLVGTADIIIAIDPGHGGEDPGSIGPSGRFEKDVTLSVSKKLADQINAIPGMRAVLTRTADYSVSLNNRTEIARRQRAHLLVSVHADAFHTPQPRGASVFVLNTRRANSEIARWVENHERQSELLGGAGEVLARTNNDRNVSQTLLDLQFSHSQKEGHKVATALLRELGQVAHLHKREPVNASLAVLKSPDIPSVLVEIGFISNPVEERLIFQRSHQDKLARAMSKALVSYFEQNPPEGTLFANRGKAQQHQVKRGESLSVIAQKYGASVADIMQANKLTDARIRIGQTLTIPGGSRAPVAVPIVTNPVETETITHVVKSGEFLGRIAANYKVTVDAIRRENNLRSDTLFVGQKLNITVSLKDKPLRKHTVQRGEFLGRIANQYNVSVQSIREANQLKSDQLAVGQVLIIPNR